MTDPIDFRAAVREAMARHGWNAAETCRRCGVDPAGLHRYLAAERDLKGETVAKLMDGLGVSLKMPRAKAGV